MSAKKLSNGEKKVISAYNGNARETAENCGLAYAYVRKIISKDYIIKAIHERDEKNDKDGKNPLIADRQERQAFWTSVARGEPQLVRIVQKMDKKNPVFDDEGNPVMEEIYSIPTMNERLKAAELLGKSNADFVDRREWSGPNGGPMEYKSVTMSKEEIEEEMKKRNIPIPKI